MNYLLSIDPGVSTGIALIAYEPETPPILVEGWQFTGGARALKGWVRENWCEAGWDGYNDEHVEAHLYAWKVGLDEIDWAGYRTEYVVDGEDYCENEIPPNLTIIAEKFTARNTKGFSYTTASLEPLRGEGILLAKDMMPDYTPKEKRWRDPGLQYLVGGSDLADKKKRQHAFLKDVGFYRTNKDFPDSPSKDGADDFRSAAAHGIAYLAKEVKHKPSFDLISEWAEGER